MTNSRWDSRIQTRRDRILEAIDRLDECEQELKDEQAEKIEKRKEEEAATGKKKRGRKPKHSQQVELPDGTKANVTNPEIQTMKTHDGGAYGYNGHAMVDTESQVIVAQTVTDEANDKQHLEPMVETCEETNGKRSDLLLTDASYWSEANADFEDEDMELFVATQRDRKRRNELREQRPTRSRTPDDYDQKELMERKLRSSVGREIYNERSTSVEPLFVQMVLRGLDRFHLRGKDEAVAEWSLFSATHNLVMLFRSGWTPARAVGATATSGRPSPKASCWAPSATSVPGQCRLSCRGRMRVGTAQITEGGPISDAPVVVLAPGVSGFLLLLVIHGLLLYVGIQRC